jgi:hypothetical protein
VYIYIWKKKKKKRSKYELLYWPDGLGYGNRTSINSPFQLMFDPFIKD